MNDGIGPVVHVVGARPNFVKAAPVIRALRERGVGQWLVHTGQHYDDRLSDVFFRELDLPRPNVNLGVGSGTQAGQTAAAMVALDDALGGMATPPPLVVLYGDVNSTLAGALVAAKRGIPAAHVEAGLRSFDDSMPEEINRRVTDLLADLLFVTSPEGCDNLARMGVPGDRTHFVGNPMIDTLLGNLARFDSGRMRAALDLPVRYAVATVHRPSNVDEPAKAATIVTMLAAVGERLPVVVPLHPRGRSALVAAGLVSDARVRVIEPLGYLDFLSLVRGATAVITDSGGVQEETTVLGIPCLTVRTTTERPITISHGTNQLVAAGGVGPIIDGLDNNGRVPAERPPLWDGHAGERIASVIVAWLRPRRRQARQDDKTKAARPSSS